MPVREELPELSDPAFLPSARLGAAPAPQLSQEDPGIPLQLWSGHRDVVRPCPPVLQGHSALTHVLSTCPGPAPPFLISCLLLLSSSLLCAVTVPPSVCPSLGSPCSPRVISALQDVIPSVGTHRALGTHSPGTAHGTREWLGVEGTAELRQGQLPPSRLLQFLSSLAWGIQGRGSHSCPASASASASARPAHALREGFFLTVPSPCPGTAGPWAH